MNVDSLIALRARQKREHRQSSRTDARLYDALHDQLRREVRRTQIRKTFENLAAVAIGVGFFVILAVAI